MKIGILQTGRRPDQLIGKQDDYDGLFRSLLGGRGFEFDTYAVLDDVFPTGPEAADGWLITGSKFGAYEDHSWIPPLEALIREIYASCRPMIGVCFGHQIIAQALGGAVEKFSGGWSIGPTDYETPLGKTLRLNAWHQDQVVQRPVDATCLAGNDFCENAVLAYGDRVLTFQGHPEFTDAFLADLFDARRDVLPPAFAGAEHHRIQAAFRAGHGAQTIAAEFDQFFRRTGAPLSTL